MAEYTPRVDGFQIRDVTYVGLPPKDAQPKYAVVKWVQREKPIEVYDLRLGQTRLSSEYCYVCADLEWDADEGCFEFRGIGLRFLEAHPSEAVMDMILDFCEKKAKEILASEGYD